MINKKVSNYIIKEFIAEGGMGTVYLCEHETLGWKAAVKILHPEYAVNKEVLSRFKNEAKTLSSLKHPNIVEILDFGVADGKPFLIMEHVEGQPLDEYISKVTGPIGEEDAVLIMKQILSAIQLAHDKGIIHRDLKPSNVIINRKKEVKILDFGIAKNIDSEDNYKTRMGQKLGTLPYMSPEQIKGLKDIGSATDIYSLGVLLHQMVTGKPPYADDLTEYDVSKNVVEYPLPRIKDIYPSAVSFFQCIIDIATAKDINKRFSSCSDYANAMIEASNNKGICKEEVNKESNSNIPTEKKQQKIEKQDFVQSQPTNKNSKLKNNNIESQKEKISKNSNKKTVIIVVWILIILLAIYFIFIKSSNIDNNNNYSEHSNENTENASVSISNNVKTEPKNEDNYSSNDHKINYSNKVLQSQELWSKDFSKIITTVKKGSDVEIIEDYTEYDNFLLVKYKGDVGYIHKFAFIEKTTSELDNNKVNDVVKEDSEEPSDEKDTKYITVRSVSYYDNGWHMIGVIPSNTTIKVLSKNTKEKEYWLVEYKGTKYFANKFAFQSNNKGTN